MCHCGWRSSYRVSRTHRCQTDHLSPVPSLANLVTECALSIRHYWPATSDNRSSSNRCLQGANGMMEPSDGENGFPMSTDALIFPSASHNFLWTLNALKHSTLRIENRLKSIEHDAQFILQVAETYCLPLVANARCGSWYIPPERKTGSAYFKSTDGHQGQWSFSTRRLNLQLLEIIGAYHG